MADEYYEYRMHASAGTTDATLKILDNGDVECEYGWGGMGTPYRYRLYGKCEAFSENYGWIRFQRVEDQAEFPAKPIPIEALETEFIYEYVKISRSEFRLHPSDALWINGRWNDYFDLILITNDFVLGNLEGLKYVIAEGELEEMESPEMIAYINDGFIEHLTHLLTGLDKMKFTRIDK